MHFGLGAAETAEVLRGPTIVVPETPPTPDGTPPQQAPEVAVAPIVEPLLQELGRKYLGGAAIEMEHFTSGNLWLFELVPRT